MKNNDAWKQKDDLLTKFTKSTRVRPDIDVYAHATDRGVELRIRTETPSGPLEVPVWKSTGKRNVGTMRELAQALSDACDFVEESNPIWAAMSSN